MALNNRSEHKIRVLRMMIHFYCRHKEGNRELCPQCQELMEYATQRIIHCPFRSETGSCRHCQVHCYKPAMREQIRKVMRYAGPRMVWYHPWEALRHLFNV